MTRARPSAPAGGDPEEGSAAGARVGVGAVLLAAGASRRAGPDNKLLWCVDGEPMVRRAARTVLAAGARPVVVVLGHDAPAVRRALADLPLEFVLNEHHAQGMGTSVACGVRAMVGRHVDACLVMLSDMPRVRTQDVQRLMAAHRARSRATIVAPVCAQPGAAPRTGNPVLWPRPYFAELSALTGDRGARAILHRDAEQVLRVAVDHDGILVDVDHAPPDDT